MLTGVILAGGDNRRMGGKLKALLKVNGKRMIEKQIEEMDPICDQLIVVTNQPDMIPKNSKITDVVSDRIPGKGPLSGMHAAFSIADCEYIWVVACDMPFISQRAVNLQIERLVHEKCEAAIPFVRGRLHPLHGVYKKNLKKKIEESLVNSHYKILDFLESISCSVMNEDTFIQNNIDISFVSNVNTPDDYNILLQQIEENR